MGFKRSFDSEDLPELNVKHARHITYCNKLAELDEAVPYYTSLEKSGAIGDDLGDLYCFKYDDNVETNVSFSWMTGLTEEESHSGATTQSSLSHESPESDIACTPVCSEEDVYWCPSSPRIPVPIGSDYQADIPECVKEEVREHLGHAIISNEEQKTGKCVIPKPDWETEVCEAGKGRKECSCMDKGSIRCVQQHIMENRKDLFETIGYDRCMNIGLSEMGEEVSGKLSEEEEDLFHKIVYSNPVSLGRDFWKQLKSAFPSRTMKDIVSYYFNVFILRRRAIQNRSKSLDIDSDDDEWQVEYSAEAPSDEQSLSRDDEEEEGVNVNEDSYCNDHVDQSYTFDHCDSIVPDHCWTKNIDLLPTLNIIEELFGQDPWCDFSRGK